MDLPARYDNAVAESGRSFWKTINDLEQSGMVR